MTKQRTIARDLYVLMTHDDWQSCMILSLEPQTEHEARSSINWQIRGGAAREQMRICRFDYERCAFVATGNGVAHAPNSSPYTVEAWKRFADELGFNGELYVRKSPSGLFELRQERFRNQFDAGNEHAHDLCATARNRSELKSMCAMAASWDRVIYGEDDA